MSNVTGRLEVSFNLVSPTNLRAVSSPACLPGVQLLAAQWPRDLLAAPGLQEHLSRPPPTPHRRYRGKVFSRDAELTDDLTKSSNSKETLFYMIVLK